MYRNIIINCLIVILIAISITTHAQQLLHCGYQYIKDESVKYNSVVLAFYYQETPIALTIAKNNDLIDYVKLLSFKDLKCISETHCYPSDLFNSKLIYLSALNGDPYETKNGDNTMYVWRKDGMKITLSLTYTTMHKKNITQINYAYDSDVDYVVDAAQKCQSPFMKYEILKAE